MSDLINFIKIETIITPNSTNSEELIRFAELAKKLKWDKEYKKKSIEYYFEKLESANVHQTVKFDSRKETIEGFYIDSELSFHEKISALFNRTYDRLYFNTYEDDPEGTLDVIQRYESKEYFDKFKLQIEALKVLGVFN